MNYFFIFFLALQSFLVKGQSNNYEFIGNLQLPDKNTISYKLNFNLKENGTLSGETITDFSGEHRTVSKISGNLSKNKKTISFSETKNISTKSTYDNANFCFVNVTNASIKIKTDKSIIQGDFIGKFPNGKKCAEGNILLFGSKQLYKKIEEVSKKISQVKPNDTKIQEGLDAKTLENEANNNILKSEDKLRINWNADHIVFDIWDTQKEDGDKISILINGVVFKRNIIVSNSKQTFSFPFKDSELTLTIIAENEGGLPSNTAQLLLKDTKESFPIMTGLKQGEKVSIILKKN